MVTVKCESKEEFDDMFSLFYAKGYAIGIRREELTLLIEK